MTKRMGRPRKARGDVLLGSVKVLVTLSEAAALRQAAAASGQTLSAWARAVLVAAAKG